jgi:hypothetical protein
MLTTNVTGVEKIQKAMAGLPDDLCNAGCEASTKYLLGVLVNREVPEQTFIPRAVAYPDAVAYSPLGTPIPGYFSWKQFKYVRALWAKGKIPYTRKGKAGGIASEWFMIGSGKQLTLVNRARGAVYLYDNRLQARQLALVGWKKISQIITEYTPQMVRSFKNAVKQVIRKRGLQ